MNKSILLLYLLSICVVTAAQPLSGFDNCKCDSSKFYFEEYSAGTVGLNIKIDSIWFNFNVIDYPCDYFEINCERVNFSNVSSNDLVLNWKVRSYGTGGGQEEGGVQVWNLDKGTKMFDEKNYYLSENFGRGETIPWLVSCEKKIKVTTNKVKVDSIVCVEEWNRSDMSAKEIIENAVVKLTSLEGIYKYVSGNLKKD